MDDGCDDQSGFSLDVDSLSWSGGEVEVVPTTHGPIMVTICGDRRKPGLITYHDIGLNHATCFQGLFLCAESSSLLLGHFCVYHIDAPGHEIDAEDMNPEEGPLTAEELAAQVEQVADYFGLAEIVGLGVGAGAYILTLFAIQQSSRVTGLILISPISQAAGWTEWAYNKALLNLLYYYGMTSFVKEQLLQRYFGPESRGILGPGSDLVQTYRRELEERRPVNVMRFMQAMQERRDLTEWLEDLPCHVLMLVGEKSSLYNDTLHMNCYLDKRRTGWVEVAGCGSLLTEENPTALQMPIQYFLMGLGYCYSPPLPHAGGPPLIQSDQHPAARLCTPPYPTTAPSGRCTGSGCAAVREAADHNCTQQLPPLQHRSRSSSNIASQCPSSMCSSPPPTLSCCSSATISRTNSSASTQSRSSFVLSSSGSAGCTSSQSPSPSYFSQGGRSITFPYSPFAENNFLYEEFSPERSGLKLKRIRTKVERSRSYCPGGNRDLADLSA